VLFRSLYFIRVVDGNLHSQVEGEIKKMEKTERDFAQGVEVTISAVEVRTNPRNPEEVTKIAFETNKGRITYKPKVTKEEYRDGLKILSTASASLGDLPEIIKVIGSTIASKGNCVVKASYNLWDTEVDGEAVTYRFVQGESMIRSWQIVGAAETKMHTREDAQNARS
jgi:hypothetical protein